MHTESTTRTTTTRRPFGRVAMFGLALAVSGLAVGCGASGKDDAATKTTKPVAADTSTTVASDAPVSTTVVTDDTTTDDTSTGSGSTGSGSNGSGSGSTGSGSGSNGGGSSSGGGTTAPPSSPAPAITSFSTPENIDCHNGDFQEFTASWATTNATKVTISIDGPGVYNTYGPSGSTSLPFNCSSSHTFLLTAYNAAGKTATRSITLQPRNVQTDVPEDEMGNGIDE